MVFFPWDSRASSGLGRPELILELETRGYEHIRDVVASLGEKGYDVTVVK